jgi:competence ComEA-like helix-hairpin-helix protein
MFERFSRKFGFTRTEIIVILFLTALFIIGYVYVEFIKPIGSSEYRNIDYSREDSLFESHNNTNTDYSIENSELKNTQAIRNDVLELSDTIAYVKKDIESLTDKSININTADVNELTKLPGIGEKTAEKIVELSTQRGKFKNLNELMDVKGIGEVKFNKIQKFLYIK